MGIDGAFDWGTLPSASLGIGLSGNFQIGHYWLELGGHYWPKSRGTASENSKLGGDIDLFEVTPQLGYVLFRKDLEVIAKFGMDLGVIGGRGTGINQPASTWATWFALHPSVDLRLALSNRFGLVLNMGGVVPMRRDKFVLEGIGNVHQASAVSVRMALGAEIRF